MVIGFLVYALAAHAAVLYVDKNLSDGFWIDSYSELSEALFAAADGDEIWVAAGVYKPGKERDSRFELKPGVKIYGGFYGGESSREDRDWIKNPTVLSGDTGVEGASEDNVFNIIYYDGILDKETVIDGFILRDGNADGETPGAAMYLVNGADLLIRNCRFADNRSATYGAAVYTTGGPVFEYCLFEENRAQTGGAVYIREDNKTSGTPRFTHCTFAGNTAAEGAAVYIAKHESVVVDSCIFWNNTKTTGGISSFRLDNRGKGASTIRNTALDDGSISSDFQSENLLYYRSSEIYGPFKNTDNYLIDKRSGIPQDYGWYYVPPPLVLNIRVFLEGPM
jgi:hypothetical protein